MTITTDHAETGSGVQCDWQCERPAVFVGVGHYSTYFGCAQHAVAFIKRYRDVAQLIPIEDHIDRERDAGRWTT